MKKVIRLKSRVLFRLRVSQEFCSMLTNYRQRDIWSVIGPARIQRKFYWSREVRDVETLFRTCLACYSLKNPNPGTETLLSSCLSGFATQRLTLIYGVHYPNQREKIATSWLCLIIYHAGYIRCFFC